jgi:hypothetical protein
VREERCSGAGEADAALLADEELLAELAFEAPDLGADGRLRHHHASGGSRELPLLGDRHEVRELP